MITHIIDNGIVVNSICATVEEAQLAYPNMTCIAAEGHGGIGWQWNGVEFSPPNTPPAPPTIPVSITPRQGRIMLAQSGLLAQVDAYFAALTVDGAEVARIEWEYAQEWRRDWPILINAATSFGLDSEQVDQMFIAAATL